jgi:hypothetical protein
MEYAKRLAPIVASIFDSLKQHRYASSRPDFHFYVDPKLAEQFNINLHMIQEADSSDADGKIVTAADKGFDGDFKEQTITFPSRRTRDPNYLCSVVFQKPEDSVFCVSAYLTDTYLGRYAYRANWFFRGTSRASAVRCFNRVFGMVKDVKQDFIESTKNQNEVPYVLRKALQGEAGEIEEKANKVALYLDPANVAPQTTIGQDIFAKGQTTHRIVDELGGAPHDPKGP